MNPRTAPSSLTGSLSKRTALLALSGLGVVLAGIVFFDIYQDWIPEGNPFWTTLLENARPLALALSIPVVAWRISRSEFGEEHLSSATRWSVLGGITMLVVASLGLGSQIVQGEIKPLIFVTQMIAAGALAGFFVSNAIKYTDEGGHVQIRAYTEETAAVLEVEDTDIGMNPDTVEELFDAFRQESEGPDREYEGSGLGLSIIKKFTERMDRTIDVETEKGEGSRFEVRLPRANQVRGGPAPPTVRDTDCLIGRMSACLRLPCEDSRVGGTSGVEFAPFARSEGLRLDP